ncbi:MAG: bifunctional riboflavin kinase/FAD synthetase [Bacteroidaceae bacterium]|nr:bifunctional riboflavin kinase/FAD synthetase [Bacteroidaceae bacterium]
MFVATIGFFDGVHCGHRFLISQVLEQAREEGLQSMVITMDCHPKTIVKTDYVPCLLTTTEERISLLKKSGIDHVEVLSFDHEMARMDAPTFMREILRDRLNISTLVMGYDHRFGHGGGEHEEYIRWGEECGIRVIIAKRFEQHYASSSEIRRLLTEGNVRDAAKLLNHPYVLTGIVESGHQVGRTLGFPTANLNIAENKLIPATGVYAVMTELGAGIMNIGRRPTLNNGTNLSIEVHIMNYEGNLYGKKLHLSFIERIREEKKFASLEELKAQIQEDINQASAMFDATDKTV